MCVPVGIYWQCCQRMECSFQLCDIGVTTGKVGYACAVVMPKPWPTTPAEWEAARIRQRIIMPRWCCSPACCVSAVERNAPAYNKDSPTNIQIHLWELHLNLHMNNCFLKYADGAGRIGFGSAEPIAGELKSAVLAQYRKELNQATINSTEQMKQNIQVSRSPYVHFVNVRNWLLTHPNESHTNWELPAYLVGPAANESKMDIPSAHLLLRDSARDRPFRTYLSSSPAKRLFV